MHILILVLVLLFLMILLPVLLPVLVVIAGIGLIAGVLRNLGPGRFNRGESSGGRRIEYTDPEQSGPFHRNEEVEAPDIMLKRPASVQDEEFWEKDHTVYDVPFEETDGDEPDGRE